MKYTVAEKLEYNRSQKSAFSYGYRLGVQAYRRYPKADKKHKRAMLAEIDDNKRLAQTGDKSRSSVQYAKGFMCAMRDCAAERRARQGK